MKKIAFCFLIYDSINHEELWHCWFQNVDESKYSIHIHYKIDKPLKYFEKYKLKNCIETKYADISLTEAQNLLIEEAIKDKSTSNIILLSNSCIPLSNFDNVYNELNSKYSYFNLSLNEHIYENNRGEILNKYFRIIKKSSQWCILNRKHSIYIIENINYNLLLKWFEKERALSDEYIYITLLINKYPEELITTYYESSKATTFEYWNDKIYPFTNNFTSLHPSNWERRLKTYDSIELKEIQFLLFSKCLFGRKFSSDCIVNLRNKLTITNYLKPIICI